MRYKLLSLYTKQKKKATPVQKAEAAINYSFFTLFQ